MFLQPIFTDTNLAYNKFIFLLICFYSTDKRGEILIECCFSELMYLLSALTYILHTFFLMRI